MPRKNWLLMEEQQPGRGYNPMRWDCERDGCFNVLRRPKIEVFADCFPRRINSVCLWGESTIGRRRHHTGQRNSLRMRELGKRPRDWLPNMV